MASRGLTTPPSKWYHTRTEEHTWRGRFGWYLIRQYEDHDGSVSKWEPQQWVEELEDYVPIWKEEDDTAIEEFDTFEEAKDFIETLDDGYDLGYN